MPSFFHRLYKALPWFGMGCLAFYIIGILGSQYQEEHDNWPQYPAEVLANNIKWAPHMSDEYALSITLNISPENGTPSYQASLTQAGPKGALEKRANSIYAVGNKILVRYNPNNIREIELANSSSWGIYLIASIVSLFFIINGMTLLNKK